MALPVTPVSTLWRDLRDEVRRQYRGGRVILGVDGVDGAGPGLGFLHIKDFNMRPSKAVRFQRAVRLHG